MMHLARQEKYTAESQPPLSLVCISAVDCKVISWISSSLSLGGSSQPNGYKGCLDILGSKCSKFSLRNPYVVVQHIELIG